ncbi:uncharacterized protein LOC122384198 isoform X1 [Amphibalanus amphitrite]|uniref:uncharacterized protein LOC122384198 isoform X1 n=1 Tax=Amphibalanus amphitrite TaxID=1232801 RepID=UPI001C904DC4|nr:uncharacterized protein LOC122384198 isoform X1 [Amphibalanus amphitrite]
MSSKDEIEILSVVQKSSEGHTCPRCGLTLGTVSLLSHHQLLLCDQRTPAESRHGRCVIEVAKRCGLDELHVFSLEREAGLERRRPAGGPRAPPPEPPAGATLEQRLEAIGRLTLEDLPDELVERLLSEAASYGGGGGEPEPGRSQLYQLDNSALSYEVLRLPQYQELFDRLRQEAAAVSPAPLDTAACRQAGIGQPLLQSLLQQAEQLRADTQSEFVEHHFCRQCQEHVERALVLNHVHAGLANTCGFCGLTVGYSTELKAHLSKQHHMQRKLTCPLCRTRHATPHAYRNHVLTHNMDDELLLPGENDPRLANGNRTSEWQCELCREMPIGVSVKFRDIREHVTSGCRMLHLSEAEFNRRFHPPPQREM